jgi:beta-lactam-binding protein with PASTA domain
VTGTATGVVLAVVLVSIATLLWRSGTPKGKDFFRITKELAEQARVELPKAEVKKEPEADAAPTTQPTPSVIFPQGRQTQIRIQMLQNDERP